MKKYNNKALNLKISTQLMSKRYIIFFDVWTKGTHHYKNLQMLLLRSNIEIILLES